MLSFVPSEKFRKVDEAHPEWEAVHKIFCNLENHLPGWGSS